MKILLLSIGVLFCLSFESLAQKRKIHLYTDADIIKLSNYIRDLEYKDSLNNKIIEQYRQELAMLKKGDSPTDYRSQKAMLPKEEENEEKKDRPGTEGAKDSSKNDWE